MTCRCDFLSVKVSVCWIFFQLCPFSVLKNPFKPEPSLQALFFSLFFFFFFKSADNVSMWCWPTCLLICKITKAVFITAGVSLLHGCRPVFLPHFRFCQLDCNKDQFVSIDFYKQSLQPHRERFIQTSGQNCFAWSHDIPQSETLLSVESGTWHTWLSYAKHALLSGKLIFNQLRRCCVKLV